MAIRVLLVDDHDMLRASLARQLGGEPDLQVVGEASDAGHATALCAELKPDLVVMDIDMPGPICFDAARDMQARVPGVRVIFLSAFAHDRYIEKALAVKACGYLTKTERPEILIRAVREVAAGGSWFSEEVRRRIVWREEGAELTPEGRTKASQLTRRESEVLTYIARGLSKKEIARTMHLSPKTVENHSSNLMAKLDIHDRVELARYAIREGLAEP